MYHHKKKLAKSKNLDESLNTSASPLNLFSINSMQYLDNNGETRTLDSTTEDTNEYVTNFTHQITPNYLLHQLVEFFCHYEQNMNSTDNLYTHVYAHHIAFTYNLSHEAYYALTYFHCVQIQEI